MGEEQGTAEVTAVTLSIEIPGEVLAQIQGAMTLVNNETEGTWLVKTQEDFDYVAEMLSSLKRDLGDVEEARKALTGPFRKQEAEINGRFKPFKEFVAKAERDGKKAMGDFAIEQNRKRAEAQAEEDRKARKKQQQLDKRAEQAAASGNMEKAQDLQEKSMATTAVQVDSQEKTEGVSQRLIWEIVVTDAKAFVAAAVENPFFMSCLEINVAAVKKLAQQLGEEFNAPGIKATSRPDFSIRR